MKKIILLFISLLLVAMFSAGCATLNESECRNADWYMIGMEDGMKGHIPSRIGEHRKACSKYNITPNINAYRAGHNEGLQQFCTEAQGFLTGKSGKSYNGVCPSALEENFLEGFRIGKEFYAVNREIERSTDAIYSFEERIDELEKEIRHKENRLVKQGTTLAERRHLLDEIKEQQKEIGELEEKILEQEKHRAVMENEYARLQNRYSY